jgi:hypothetical protein
MAGWEQQQGRGLSSQYIQIISKMIFDEPAVYGMIANLQSMCLKHGIMVRWGHTPATPSFQAHIQRHYVPFCREAIVCFLAVGFVPYRLRKVGHATVPEALPLGTFSWSVCPSANRATKAMRTTAETASSSSGPLLIYDVTSTHCSEPLHVFNYVHPHATLNCYSPLAALIPLYNALLSVREVDLRAMLLNAQPSLVLEEQDKTMMNSIAESGSCIANMSNSLSDGVAQSEREKRAAHIQGAVETSKAMGNLPETANIFVAPKNNTARGIDKVLPPQHIHEREVHFARCVATALGLPASMGGPQVSSGHKTSQWQESPEMHNRILSDACLKINRALQYLLSEVYARVYAKAEKQPTFLIPIAPVLPHEHLLPLFDAKVLDDNTFSLIFEASTGFPLGAQALAAREDRHKASTALPKPAAPGS